MGLTKSYGYNAMLIGEAALDKSHSQEITIVDPAMKGFAHALTTNQASICNFIFYHPDSGRTGQPWHLRHLRLISLGLRSGAGCGWTG